MLVLLAMLNCIFFVIFLCLSVWSGALLAICHPFFVHLRLKFHRNSSQKKILNSSRILSKILGEIFCAQFCVCYSLPSFFLFSKHKIYFVH